MELLDPDDPVGFGDTTLPVTPIEHAFPDEVGAGVLVQDRRLWFEGRAGVDQRLERFVLHLDQLGCVARELAGRRDDRHHRLADEARLADRERIVLDLASGRHRHLEERVGQDRDLVAGQRPVDIFELGDAPTSFLIEGGFAFEGVEGDALEQIA